MEQKVEFVRFGDLCGQLEIEAVIGVFREKLGPNCRLGEGIPLVLKGSEEPDFVGADGASQLCGDIPVCLPVEGDIIHHHVRIGEGIALEKVVGTAVEFITA